AQSSYSNYGYVTNEVSTYTLSDGSAGNRPRQWTYDNNTNTYTVSNPVGGFSQSTSYIVPDLLRKEIGVDSQPVAQYGGFDSIQTTNTYIDPFWGTNTVVFSYSRVLPRYQTNALNELTQFTYDSASRVKIVTTPSGFSRAYDYFTNGTYVNFLRAVADSDTNVTYRLSYFTYTTGGLLHSYTDPRALTITNTWDNLLRLTSVTYPDTTYASNSYNRLDLSGAKDRLGNWTYLGYDSMRHPTAVTNALSNKTFFTWCGCGSLESITNALGEVAAFVYDNQSRLRTVSFTNNLCLNYSYDLAGRVTNVT